MTLDDVQNEIRHLDPEKNSLQKQVFYLVKKGRFEEALHHYRKAQEYESWDLPEGQLRKHKSKRMNARNKKVYGADYSKARNLRPLIHREQNYRCKICGTKKTLMNLELDHIKAMTEGGTNDRKNLQLLCRPCHMEKDSHLINQTLEQQIPKNSFPHIHI